MVKIKDLPKFERPREKLIKKGVKALYKNELIAIILRTGISGKSAISVADDILKKYGERKIIEASYQELKNMHGVGPTKAAQIIASIELGRRLFKPKAEKEVYINSSDDVLKEVNHLRENNKENFVTLYLDARNRLICKETVSIGTVNANLVHPREVFEPAVRNLAVEIILVHNHPSGDPDPSEDDLEITKKLIAAGKIVGIEVIDHLIVTKTSYFSFKDKGLI